MRIAVDVMGGDHGCGVIIAGVKGALEENKDLSTIYLVGNKTDIHAAPPPRGFRDHRVRIIHTTEVVEMEDKPVVALRKKKDSSIARAAELVRDGEADALISLGNTGGIFAAATFKVGRIGGVDRGCASAGHSPRGHAYRPQLRSRDRDFDFYDARHEVRRVIRQPRCGDHALVRQDHDGGRLDSLAAGESKRQQE